MNFWLSSQCVSLPYIFTHLFTLLLIAIKPIKSLAFVKNPNLLFIPYNVSDIYKRTDPGISHKNELYSRDSRVTYLAEERFYKMIMDKYSQVDKLIEEHKDPNDKLQLRLNFLQCTSNLKLSDMLKRNTNQNHHKLSVIADMKRRTPTHNPKCDNNILSYSDAGEVALNMAGVGFDVIFVNTDEVNYGGHINDLHRTFLELRKLGRRERPAIVMKDIVLHPIQIAQAAELRADGVILNSAILGNALKDLFNVCITLGIEPIVEVHTINEALRAVDIGFNHIMINQWDRISNVLFPTRALEIKDALPEHIVAIATGGIMTMDQVHQLALLGFNAVCFGRRLVYPDVPDFIKQVKEWKGPSKPILRMTKSQFFNYEEEEGKPKITLKENHLALLNEMNYFYFGKGNEVNLSDELEKINEDEEYKIDYDKELTEEQKSREITINLGTPTREESLVKVNDITTTLEGQDKDFDVNIHSHNKRVEKFKLKWYVEKKKWLKENKDKYENEDEASEAYDLKKAIEMYNHFIHIAKPNLKGVLSEKEMEETEKDLLENVKMKYKTAPKENGKVKLNFEGLETPLTQFQ